MKREKIITFGNEFFDRSGAFVAFCLGIFMLLFTAYTFAFSDDDEIPEEELKTIIEEYYHAMNFNKIEKLPRFLSPTVCEWYGTKEMTLNEIMKDVRIHHSHYPYSYSEVDWDSFKVEHLESGEYIATYKLVHRTKQNINEHYQVYHLNIRTHWDSHFKMRSISETRINE